MQTVDIRSDVIDATIDHAAFEAHLAWYESKASDNLQRIASIARASARHDVITRLQPLTPAPAIKTAPSLIMVVDDEQIIAITLSEILRRHGFNAIWFTAPADALEFVKNCGIDLLLSDITMPMMDGITLAAEVLSLRSECAVFLLSARGHESDVRQRVRSISPCIHVETKPIRAESLIMAIKLLLAGI